MTKVACLYRTALDQINTLGRTPIGIEVILGGICRVTDLKQAHLVDLGKHVTVFIIICSRLC